MFYRLTILFFCCTFSCVLWGQETPLLKESDIHRIMEEIFQQHVAEKGVSKSIIQSAIKNFFQQADPDNLYLLADETKSYLSPDPAVEERVIQQYKQGDYSFFAAMNGVIQKAFLRAEQRRQAMQEAFPIWIDEVASEGKSYPDTWSKEAQSEQELNQRMEFYFKAAVASVIHHYGKGRAVLYKKALIQKFEETLRDKEDLYLYVTAEGKALSAEERENLFSLHILKALAAALDSHTKVFNPEEAFDMRLRLEKGFKGLGMVLEPGDEGLRVAELLPNSPAAKSQLIYQGDELIAVNGTSLKGKELQEGLQAIREMAGDKVLLTLLRGEGGERKLLQIQLKKEYIPVNAGRAQIEKIPYGNGIIGIIKLDAFYQGEEGVSSEQDVKEAIDKLDEENLKGLILDLRENSGGFLTQAVKIVGLFISNGVVAISKYASGEEKIYRDLDGKAEYKGPLIVLVSRLTASAAEIVAQALQDYGVALIVGDDHTYGKGTIQSQTVTGDQNASSYFKVTVGKYYTVSGKTPQLQGVVADIVVPGPLESRKIGEGYQGSSIKQDAIAPAYQDTLADIDPQLKPWYLKYYIPTLQQRDILWTKLLPSLKQKSAYRIVHNADYQQFLTSHQEAFSPGQDYQLQEAIYILKDSLYLEHKSLRQE